MKKAFEEVRMELIRMNRDVIVTSDSTSTGSGEGNESGSNNLD